LRALLAVLHARAGEMRRGLERVRGRVELGVRALEAGRAAAPRRLAASVHEHLLERRRAAARLADRLHPAFSELAVESVCELAPAEGVVFAGAYLVERPHARELQRRVERLGGERDDIELVCTGPWPPYHFTRDVPG
jgi:hypothetical protein